MTTHTRIFLEYIYSVFAVTLEVNLVFKQFIRFFTHAYTLPSKTLLED